MLPLLAFVCCLGSLVPTRLEAQCTVYSDYIRVLGSVDGITEGWDAVIERDFAYVADGTSGVRVINVASPSMPVVVHRLVTQWFARGVDCEDGHLYVARGQGGLAIYDLGDPASPVLQSETFLPGFSVNLVVRGARAYVISQQSGLAIVDVSDPSSPQVVGTLDTPGIGWGLAVDGDRILIADGPAGLHVVDISDEASPVIVHTVDTPGAAFQVALRDEVAYVADRVSGVKIIALDATPPSIVGTIATRMGADAFEVITIGNHLLVINDELRTFDISTPASPAEIGSVYTWGWAIAVSEHWVGVVSGRGLFSVSLDNLASPPVVLADYDPDPMHWSDLAFQGNHAFVASGPEGVVVLDVSEPSHPQLAGVTPTTRQTNSVAVDNSRLYVGDFDGFRIYDCTDPTDLQLLSTLPGLWIYGIAVHGDYVFTGRYEQTFAVIDVHDPASPQIVRTFPQYEPTDLAIVGTTLYVADYELGLLIFDIADPPNPVLLGSLSPWPGAIGIAVDGSFAYVSRDSPEELAIVRVANPQSPALVSQVPTLDTAFDVVVGGGYAYVTTRLAGIQVVDVRHPTAPRTVGWHDAPPFPVNIKLREELLWVYGDELYILPTQCRPVALAISGFRGTYAAGSVRLEWTSSPHERFRVFRAEVDDLESVLSGESQCNGNGNAVYLEAPPLGTTLRYELGSVFDDAPDPSLGAVFVTVPSAARSAVSFAGPFPNPTLSASQFVLTLPHAENVRLGIYDVSGRLVRLLTNGRRDPGDHAIAWDGKDGAGQGVSAGVYFVNLSSEHRTESRKVVLRRP